MGIPLMGQGGPTEEAFLDRRNFEHFRGFGVPQALSAGLRGLRTPREVGGREKKKNPTPDLQTCRRCKLASGLSACRSVEKARRSTEGRATPATVLTVMHLIQW